MNSIKYFVALTAILLMYSCTSVVTPPPEVKAKLRVESAINPEAGVELEMTVSQLIGGTPIPARPQTADIWMSGTGIQGEVGFVYLPTEQKYLLRTTSFRPQEGGEYEITAFLPEYDLDTILAFTQVPEGHEIVSQEILSHVNKADENGLIFTEVQLQLDLGDIREGSNYLHLIPSYRFVDLGGNIGDREVLEVKNIVENNASNVWIQEEGFAIERSKLYDGTVTVTLSTINSFDSTLQDIKSINWEVRAASEEYFEYNTYIDKVDSCPSECNIRYYSNVDKGAGFLGSYAVRHQEFYID